MGLKPSLCYPLLLLAFAALVSLVRLRDPELTRGLQRPRLRSPRPRRMAAGRASEAVATHVEPPEPGPESGEMFGVSVAGSGAAESTPSRSPRRPRWRKDRIPPAITYPGFEIGRGRTTRVRGQILNHEGKPLKTDLNFFWVIRYPDGKRPFPGHLIGFTKVMLDKNAVVWARVMVRSDENGRFSCKIPVGRRLRVMLGEYGGAVIERYVEDLGGSSQRLTVRAPAGWKDDPKDLSREPVRVFR